MALAQFGSIWDLIIECNKGGKINQHPKYNNLNN